MEPRNQSSPNRLILASVFIVGAGQTVVFAVVPVVARSTGLTEIQSSLIFAASAAMMMLVSPWWGRVCDRIGRLPVVLFGLTSYGVLLAMLALILRSGQAGASALFVFAAAVTCRGLHGALTAGVLPAAQAELGGNAGASDRVGNMATVSIAFGIGSLLGPGMVGLLVKFGELASLWFLAAAALIMAVLFYVRSRAAKAVQSVAATVPALQLTTELRWLLLVSSVFYCTFFGTLQLLGFTIQDRFHYLPADSVVIASGALVIMALSTLATQAAMLRLRSDQARSFVVAGLVLGAIAYGIAARETGFGGAVAALMLLGSALGLIMPSLAALASATSRMPGAALGAISSTQALGSLIGPVLAASLYSISPSLPYAIDAAALGCCVLVAATRLRGTLVTLQPAE
jgi:MFS family permease